MNIGIDLEMAHRANSDKRHGGAAGGGWSARANWYAMP
jgi:hypothetical protein